VHWIEELTHEHSPLRRSTTEFEDLECDLPADELIGQLRDHQR
jgi:hypothetical protein